MSAPTALLRLTPHLLSQDVPTLKKALEQAEVAVAERAAQQAAWKVFYIRIPAADSLQLLSESLTRRGRRRRRRERPAQCVRRR